MRKKPIILEELFFWLRGRFTLTREEKVWLLLVLMICWVGLLGRYLALKHQAPEKIVIEEMTGDAL